MVIQTPPAGKNRQGFLLLELFVAIGLLASVVLPLAYGQWYESNSLRRTYQHAVAMELIDGEMEILADGEWRQFGQGEHVYALRAAAATNLPPGHCTLTISGKHLRLEWKPDQARHGRALIRETEVR